jgi:hypothetical protein
MCMRCASRGINHGPRRYASKSLLAVLDTKRHAKINPMFPLLKARPLPRTRKSTVTLNNRHIPCNAEPNASISHTHTRAPPLVFEAARSVSRGNPAGRKNQAQEAVVCTNVPRRHTLNNTPCNCLTLALGVQDERDDEPAYISMSPLTSSTPPKKRPNSPIQTQDFAENENQDHAHKHP